MAEIRFAENFLSVRFLVDDRLRINLPDPHQPSTAALDTALAEANRLYLDRHYEDAAAAYRNAHTLMQGIPSLPAGTDVAHDYRYAVPLGLAESYHALGDYQSAIAAYQEAAQAPNLQNQQAAMIYLWQRMATAFLDQGNSLFRNDQTQDALDSYSQVITPDDKAPDSSPLYTLPNLKPGADIARRLIDRLWLLILSITSNPNPATLIGHQELLGDVNPQITGMMVEVRQQIQKIKNGLDYFGQSASSVPIWTFEYLQGIAVNFAQLAMNAERDVINFWSQADRGNLTRQQLLQAAGQAQAEVNAALRQQDASQAELDVYNAGLKLANQRAKDAQDNASDYGSLGPRWIEFQAASSQMSGGDNGDRDQLDQLAQNMINEKPTSEWYEWVPGPPRNSDDIPGPFGDDSMHGEKREGWSGSRATMAAAAGLAGSKLSQQYELASLNRQSKEMGLAAEQAQKEADAAQARLDAARASTAVAQLRANDAQQSLAAFDSQRFTPDVWYRMGDTMYRLYRRYLDMTLRTARLMQQAYNFENDQSLHLIKNDYSATEVNGLLAADALMADIQCFTYDLVTRHEAKPQPLKQTVSLAARYPYAFERQLRPTGVMEFETRIEDFDDVYPGTYAGRIEAVEVELVGIIPPTGVTGTLTNSGISGYRVPAALWTQPDSSGLKYRVQPKETLVLSDFNLRQDGALFTADTRARRVMQGAGLVSSWRLEIPPDLNDLDYGALTDIRLTFYYKARFDPDLRDRVRQQLAAQPELSTRTRSIPLRWVYPDLFARLQSSGTVQIPLKKGDFRRNETDPVITGLGVLVVTDGSIPPAGLQVTLTAPTRNAATGTTGADGSVSFEGDALGGTAIGTYELAIHAADGGALVQNGKMPVANLALVLNYSFTPRGKK